MGLRLTCPLPLAHAIQAGETDPQWDCQRQEETRERDVVPWLLGLPLASHSLGSGYTHCPGTQNPGYCWKDISWDLVTDSTVLFMLGH